MPIRRIKNVRNFDLCRDCSHHYLSHLSAFGFPVKCQMIYDETYLRFVSCSCLEFKPKDNLKYLEYLYDKKYA
jgi:hypothetical protein